MQLEPSEGIGQQQAAALDDVDMQRPPADDSTPVVDELGEMSAKTVRLNGVAEETCVAERIGTDFVWLRIHHCPRWTLCSPCDAPSEN